MPRQLALLIALATSLSLAGIAASAAPAGIRIAKIYYDSPGADGGSNSSLNAEWIRLLNTGPKARWLTGWTVRDSANHVYRLGSYKLGAGKTVTIHTGSGGNTARHRYWGQDWYVWNNDKDTAKLKNKAGTLIDSCSYDNSSADYKVC